LLFDKREMKVGAGGPQTDSVVLIFKKRQERFAQFNLCRLRDDLGCSRTNGPVLVAKRSTKQAERFLVLLSSQDKEYLGAIRKFRILQEFTDCGIAIPGSGYGNVADPLANEKQEGGLR